jgi:hypothetical protein
LCDIPFCGVSDIGVSSIPEIYNIYADEFREMLDLAKDLGRDNRIETR